MELRLRQATLDDRPALQALIEDSARRLSREDYAAEQIESAVRFVFGVDTDLIEDGTFILAEADGKLVGCGGWSKRKTLFGGDQYERREAEFLTPARDAAKIRAFFTHPDYARRGVGAAILRRCEEEAAANGFRSCELMATLPGRKLYERYGYVAGESARHVMGDGVEIEFVPMRRILLP